MNVKYQIYIFTIPAKATKLQIINQLWSLSSRYIYTVSILALKAGRNPTILQFRPKRWLTEVTWWADDTEIVKINCKFSSLTSATRENAERTGFSRDSELLSRQFLARRWSSRDRIHLWHAIWSTCVTVEGKFRLVTYTGVTHAPI